MVDIMRGVMYEYRDIMGLGRNVSWPILKRLFLMTKYNHEKSGLQSLSINY